MESIAIRLGLGFALFVATFWLVARAHKRITIEPAWATPVVGAVFALQNVAFYWIAKPVLAAATANVVTFAIPFALNAGFLYATIWVASKLRTKLVVDGARAMIIMCVALTCAHGVLALLFDAFG